MKEAIKIRSASLEDAEGIHRILQRPQVMRNTLQYPFRDIKHTKNKFDHHDNNLINLVAITGDNIVGSAGFVMCEKLRQKHMAELFIAIDPDYQGQGVGSALMSTIIDLVDNWLHLTRLQLTVFCDNHIAIGLYEKFGFVTEGKLSNFAFTEGQFLDALIMARVVN